MPANPIYPLKPTVDLSTFFILRGIEILNHEGGPIVYHVSQFL